MGKNGGFFDKLAKVVCFATYSQVAEPLGIGADKCVYCTARDRSLTIRNMTRPTKSGPIQYTAGNSILPWFNMLLPFKSGRK